MLPPSPDRFAPQLQEVYPVDQIRLDLIFNEDINFSVLNQESFLITTTDYETLPIRTIQRGTNSNIITIYTRPLKPLQYFISGTVEDRYNNIAHIKRNFKASSIIDTFPPRITSISPKIGTTKKNHNVFFKIRFSEPIDTTGPVNFIIYPLDKSRINWQYSNDWQTLTFGYLLRGKSNNVLIDSLPPNTIVYFMLQPTLTDLSNNHMKNCAYTFFSTESILPSVIASGNLYYQNLSYADGIIIFSNPKTKAITVSDPNGKFSVRLDAALYNISAVKDTNFDNLVDLSAEVYNFNPLDTIPLNLFLQPIEQGKEIDYYLR